MTQTLRSLWAEPRAPDAPGPSARDWALVGMAAFAGVVETVLRPDLTWRAVSLIMVIALACTLPWRRTKPLLMVALAFGTASTLHLVAILRDVEWEGLGSGIFLLILPYSLGRWGSGREVEAGLVVLAAPVALTAVGGSPAGDVIGGAVILTLAVVLGGGVRYQQSSRQQELDGIRSREREQLARELHDTVAHHVSAIAVQAQAGRALFGNQPQAAVDALVVIEEEASRTLEEMRSMVGALRNGAHADLAPLQGVGDLERLARSNGENPQVEVQLGGDLTDLRPSVDAALYRLAQEAVTNALRHARQATIVRVRIRGDDDCIELTVDDDGQGGPSQEATGGFGLIGMSERTKLLGGSMTAGPRDDRGWTVSVVLPRRGGSG